MDPGSWLMKVTIPDGYSIEMLQNNKPSLKKFRKELRNNLTPAEALLWKCLKNKQLEGKKFRRQHSINNYILDFYCSSEKLAIELDGEGHHKPNQSEYDCNRDLFLNSYGIRILRFENREIFQNLKYSYRKNMF